MPVARQGLSVTFDKGVAGVLAQQPLPIFLVAQQVSEIAQAFAVAERALLAAQVGDVDQAQMAVGGQHHVAEVQRSKVHTLLVQLSKVPAQLESQ